MFLLRKPTDAKIGEYLARQVAEPFSYDCLGCTRELAGDTAGQASSGTRSDTAGQASSGSPRRRGWNVDRHRVLLGHGAEAFGRASAAIDAWEMFPRELATVYGCEVPRENLHVAVLFRAFPFPLWLLMAARVVYLIDDAVERAGHSVHRHGFAYGTLPDHPERGEERFLVEWDRNDDSVHYDLLAISQPRHLLAPVGYPYTRLEQARFRRQSGLAMQRACGEGSRGLAR